MDNEATYRGVVYPWQCDHNGHMNVMWYVSKFDEANWSLLARVGLLKPSYAHEEGRGFAALQQNISYKLSDLQAQITHRLIVGGSYRHHLENLRPRLARNMSLTIDHLLKLGCTPWARPRDGMFVWVELPQGLDSSELAQRALEHKMVLAPGNVFSLSLAASRYLRFNVAQCGKRRVFDTLARLMKG
ncbi:MAG TPA: aminotransferase class I/II-fold pyridoxal phosphate-dependent enzyme [Paraburkholderia sp.]|jgi:DNA-binding transcriptional MocR family regulator